MKNLNCFVSSLVLSLLFIPTISSDLFAIVTKYPLKSGIEEAFNTFSEAEKEFRKGQKFQDKKDFENASVCYVKSLELWPTDEAYFKLTCCIYSAKFYSVAQKMAVSGLQSSKQKGNLKNYFEFLVLLAEIYFESENFKKALVIYEYLAELPIDEKSLNFIDKRIGLTLFEIVRP